MSGATTTPTPASVGAPLGRREAAWEAGTAAVAAAAAAASSRAAAVRTVDAEAGAGAEVAVEAETTGLGSGGGSATTDVLLGGESTMAGEGGVGAGSGGAAMAVGKVPGVGGKKRQRLGALDALLDREDWAPLRDELRSTLLLLSPEREWGLRTMGGGRECESDRPSELAYKLLLLHTLRRHIVGSAAASSASLFSEFPVAHRFVDILLSLPATTVLFELKQVPAHLVVQAGRPEHLAALHRLAPERLRELWVRPYGEDTDYTVRHYASRVHRRQLLPYWRTLRDSCLTGRSAVQRRLRTPGHRVLLVTLVFLGANSYAHIVRTSLTEGDGPTPEEELSALLRQQCTIIGEEGRRAP